MFFHIPIFVSYQASVSGTTVKEVQCENCQEDFLYSMERTASGSEEGLVLLGKARALEKAQAKAEKELAKILARDIDAVPCPQCGWYQSNMIPLVRRQKYQWMRYTGSALLGVLIVLLLVTLIAWLELNKAVHSVYSLLLSADILVGTVAVGLLIGKKIRGWQYDPNAQDEEERKQLGQSRAVLVKELETSFQEQDN